MTTSWVYMRSRSQGFCGILLSYSPNTWVPEEACQVQELSCPCPAFQNQRIQNLFSAACCALIDDRVPTSNPTSRGTASFTQKNILYAPPVTASMQLGDAHCGGKRKGSPKPRAPCAVNRIERNTSDNNAFFRTVIEIEIDTTGTLPHYQGHPSFRS